MDKNRKEKLQPYFIIIGVIFVFLLIAYLIGVWFYQSRFLPNTSINAFSVSNQTVASAQESLNERLKQHEIIFSENDQELGYIHLDQIGGGIEATSLLNQTIEEQNPMVWPIHLLRINRVAKEDTSLITFDNNLLSALLDTLQINNDERSASLDAHLINNQEEVGYQLVPEVLGNQVDEISLSEALIQHVITEDTQLDLNEAYILPKIYTDDAQITSAFEEIEKMQNTEITFEFADTEVKIPKAEIASWIYIDENQQPAVEMTKIEDYILSLNQEYASLFHNHTFSSTYSGEVSINPGTYGWYIDRFEEAKVVLANLQEGGQFSREPLIGGSGYMTDNYFGNSYVEVDIAHQMMWIYINGELALSTPIVSGEPGTNTIPGAYQVWFKEEDSTLRDYNPRTEQDYEVPVDYWIAFDDQAQGIHDASWQGYFGGDAYLTNGSLGCINTPPSVMPQVFELVSYGMPVIVF